LGLQHAQEPLLRQMQAAGLLSGHPSGIGVAAAPNGGILRADGRPIGWLWAIGPLLRGVQWESTAIPEIRDQAAGVAAAVAGAVQGGLSPTSLPSTK
jgi:uncharacterized NAD(P)/FAD-binding protein YdhS